MSMSSCSRDGGARFADSELETDSEGGNAGADGGMCGCDSESTSIASLA